MSRTRVDLVAPPMSGHLHPLLGIGRRLARDREVRVISAVPAQPEIAAAGLTGVALRAGADGSIKAITNPPHAVGSSPFRLHAQWKSNLALLQQVHAELLDLWRDDPPGLVIADFTVPVAGSAARERGIPWWTTAPSPCAIETLDGPPAYLGGWKPWPGPLGHVRDGLGRAVIRGFKRGVHWMDREALTALGFPEVYRADGYEAIYSPACVLALGLEELEFPRRYPSAVTFVGPVLYTPPVEAPPPPSSGDRPCVLVTIGTHLSWRRDALVSAVRQAARALPGVEFHLSDGDRNSTRHDREANFHRLGFVSYARDLPGYSLVVHHGGAGALSHTLAHGLPALIIPADYDQFDNAARLEWAGAGLRVHRLRELAGLVDRVLGDKQMRARCRDLQRRVVAGAAEELVAARVAAALGLAK